jgi:endonuclease/exonuclease/phosphatase family metal-dependent hydrolase
MTRTLAIVMAAAAGLLPSACARTTQERAQQDSTAPGQAVVADTIRVLTYNIHIGRGTDGRSDLPRVARVITRAGPHVASLQEVDSATQRTGRLDEPLMLAGLTGLPVRFARAMPYDGGAYGVAVQSALPIGSFEFHPLPADSAHEPRTVAAIRTVLPRTGLSLLFLATHLDHTADPRTRALQVDSIIALFAGDTAAVSILAGDLNASPDSPAIQRLREHWTDAGTREPTFPAGSPDRKIDYVLHAGRARIRVLASDVIDEPVASDHRPLLVVLEVREP